MLHTSCLKKFCFENFLKQSYQGLFKVYHSFKQVKFQQVYICMIALVKSSLKHILYQNWKLKNPPLAGFLGFF